MEADGESNLKYDAAFLSLSLKERSKRDCNKQRGPQHRAAGLQGLTTAFSVLSVVFSIFSSTRKPEVPLFYCA